MTVISSPSYPLAFNKSLLSDPNIRPYIEDFYNLISAPLSESAEEKESGIISLEQQEHISEGQINNLKKMHDFLIQNMDDSEDTDVTETIKEESSAVKAFFEFMNMTPEERYIAQALASKGYTKEEFEALPLDEQQKIMEEIREELREKIEDQVEFDKVRKSKVGDLSVDVVLGEADSIDEE